MSEKHGKIKHSKAVAWQPELELWPEAQREWAETAAAAMVFADAPAEAISTDLALVRESMAASGQDAVELFGEPYAYGRKTGKRYRAAPQVLEGALIFNTFSGALRTALASLGMLLLLLGIWTGFSDGWMKESYAGPVLLLFVLITALMVLAFGGWLLRTRGQLRTALVIWAAVLLGTAGSIWLMVLLGDFDAPGPPNWIPPLAGLILVIIGLKLPDRTSRELFDDSRWDDTQYFAHSANLLRGRYLFTRAQAESALAEARAHRRESNVGSASAEFGNVEVFTAQLAATLRTPITRGVLLRRIGFSAVVAFYGTILIPELFAAPITVWLVAQAAMWFFLVVLMIFAWRPTRIAAETMQRHNERKADARSLTDTDED